MTVTIPFNNSFAALPGSFYTKLPPTPVRDPHLIVYNDKLGETLGIHPGEADALAQVFSGCQLAQGSEPLAQLYTGHQFGNFAPQLGDGRAHLLGEVIASDGVRRDIQLKGSGRTPYSRGGDGRAWLGPVLREYLVSETMAALGVPTTRALCAVTTGEVVLRETGPMPGAVLTRVARSHLRVGTFQVFAARRETANLKRLTQYAIDRHYPEATCPMDLLRAVCAAQAELIAQWMAVGFIHGVMNTDNALISGETIDYGPCAFMDRYHPDTVYSSIDRMGRYGYSNQPSIAVWNMAQLATALIQQMDDREKAAEEATEIVHNMPNLLHAAWLTRFRAKLGLQSDEDIDEALISDFLALMTDQEADFTSSFRALGTPEARQQFSDPDGFDQWHIRWRARCARETDVNTTLSAANPTYIPRNHMVEKMIQQALSGDFSLFHQMLGVLSHPYEDQPGAEEFARPPTKQEEVRATFCGT